MVAMLVDEASGDEADTESLTPELAHRWGAALARFHEAAPVIDARGRRLESSDPDLSVALMEIGQQLEALDARDHRRVTMHGDFELDNVRFTGDHVEAFDADETRAGWAAEDVALATRDLRGEAGSPALPGLFDAFVAGYRSIAPFSDAELDAVPLHAVAHSARWATDYAILDEGALPTDPEWQRDLHASITETNEWHRRALLTHWKGSSAGIDEKAPPTSR